MFTHAAGVQTLERGLPDKRLDEMNVEVREGKIHFFNLPGESDPAAGVYDFRLVEDRLIIEGARGTGADGVVVLRRSGKHERG